MDIIERIWEEQELDRLLFREGFKTMANFKRIGKRVVNLDNVKEVVYQPKGGFSHDLPCVVICFVGDDSETIYKTSEPETFSQLMTWIDEQPMLLSDEE